ncbi:DMT family transporter, partial [Thioclava sp. BHET1]
MTPQQTIPARAWAELFLLALIWGGSFLAIRLSLDQVGVFTTVAIRVAGAALVLWAYVLIRGLPMPRGLRLWGVFLVMGLLNNVIPFSLITWGELRIPSGLAGILNAASAFFGVLVAAAVFADERLSLRRLIGILLGLAGVALAIGLDVLRGLDLTSLSQLAVLGAAMSYAFSAAFARRHLRGIAPQLAAAGMVTASSVVMIPLALWQEGWPDLHLSLTTLGGLGYLAVAATALAYLLYYRVIAMAGAGNVGLVTLLVAPIAILAGALVLGEALHPSAYLGFVLVA